MLTWKQAEEKYGPLLSLHNASSYSSIDPKILLTLIENGTIDGLYLRGGIDVEVRYPHQKYVFFAHKLDEFKSRYKPLKTIAKELGVSQTTIMRWAQDGHWKPLAGTTRLWDSEKIRAKLPRTIEDFLNSEQKALIDAYVAHRKSNRPIRFHGNSFGTGIASEEREKSIKRTLVATFYRIICGRSGIVGFSNLENNYAYRPLTDAEKAKFDPSLFEVRNFRHTDMEYIEEGLSPSTAFNYYQELKPFLYWFLKQEELKPENDEQYTPEFQATVNRIMRAIDMLPNEHPGFNESREKVFLTREQVIRIYQGILKSPLHDPLEAVTQFMVGCLLGLRPPSEYSKIRIEYFELDHAGFLKTDTAGYGKLQLPKHATKGAYSWSHKKYGTIVVPLLVKLINRYLSHLYELFPEGRGKGYMFRPDPQDVDRRYSSSSSGLENWVDYVRGLTQITPDVERIVAYDTRHTINNIIVQSVLSDPALLKAQERAAEIHVRHNMDEETGDPKYGSVGNVHYRKDIEEGMYRKIIDETLNFPWDLDELKKWEIERGYRTAPEPEMQQPSPSVHPSSPAEGLTDGQKAAAELLKQYRNEYAKLGKGRPRPMNPNDWMQRLDWLQKQISHLEISAARNF